VTVSPLSANLYGGSMNGTAAVNAASAAPQFALKQNLSGVLVGPLLKDLANKDMLDGKGTVNVDVHTQGTTVGALKRAMNGGASVYLRDGSIKGIDIAATVRDAKAVLGTLNTMKGEKTQAADNSKKTEFSELSGTFAITNGVARNNDLALKSPLLRVTGAGEINVGADTINYLVKASIVGTLTGQDGRSLNELKGVTVPVRASGPLTAPSFALDFNALLTDTVKQKAEDLVKDKIQESLFGKKPAAPGAAGATPAPSGRDAAQDVLKGIFGR
jgi:AsmA protein